MSQTPNPKRIRHRPPSLTDLREDVTYHLGRKRGAIALHNAMAQLPGMTVAIFEASYRHCEAVAAEHEAARQALQDHKDHARARHVARCARIRAEQQAADADTQP
jgi:hypothetical protein